MFDGKPVWKQDNFTYEAVKVGDYVEQAIVDAAMDCVPPACMRADCSQMGEPYSARMDEKTGRPLRKMVFLVRMLLRYAKIVRVNK